MRHHCGHQAGELQIQLHGSSTRLELAIHSAVPRLSHDFRLSKKTKSSGICRVSDVLGAKYLDCETNYVELVLLFIMDNCSIVICGIWHTAFERLHLAVVEGSESEAPDSCTAI
jgi:hypothetical protein